jgi:OmpA-OmpF porin, OOP family
MRSTSIAVMLVTFLPTVSFSQQDAENCKDHPLFTRLSNFLIGECQENFNTVDFQTGKSSKTEAQEGNVTTIRYGYYAEGNVKKPSPLQIIKNYENAIVSKGGKKIYTGPDDAGGGAMAGTFRFSSDGKDYWVTVRSMYEGTVTGEVDAFTLIVMEKEAMKQDIVASALFEELNKKGNVALYINFETGKSTIQPESKRIIDEVTLMLKENPSLQISVEGHTDNTGTAAANKILSENRAKAVTAALVSNGIDKARLTSKGWGQERSIADNATEDGKAKNRRVEIVKK